MKKIPSGDKNKARFTDPSIIEISKKSKTKKKKVGEKSGQRNKEI